MRNLVALVAVIFAFAGSDAFAVTINTNNVASADYIAFNSGATVQNFESVSGLTPLNITAYTNGTPMPAGARCTGRFRAYSFTVAEPTQTIPWRTQEPRSRYSVLAAVSLEMPIRAPCSGSAPDYDRSDVAGGAWVCGRQLFRNHLFQPGEPGWGMAQSCPWQCHLYCIRRIVERHHRRLDHGERRELRWSIFPHQEKSSASLRTRLAASRLMI